MTNVQLLNDFIEASGLRIGFICDKLGLSRQAFNLKRRNLVEFKVTEVLVLKEILNLTDEQRDEIFFAQDVDKLSTIKEGA